MKDLTKMTKQEILEYRSALWNKKTGMYTDISEMMRCNDELDSKRFRQPHQPFQPFQAGYEHNIERDLDDILKDYE